MNKRKMQRMKIAVSACLLGDNCKYNGGNNYNEQIAALADEHKIIPVCPEVLGGLPTPRKPAEIVDGVVKLEDGTSVDREFRRGALAAMKIIAGADMAILQSRSPSCGVKTVYDGTFSGHIIQGSGVFAQMLKDAGIPVIDAADYSKKRCSWCNMKNPRYIAYHDSEWGVPCHDERKLYELFILETFQAGLSWECILNKRENFRKAYDGFDLDAVCAYGEEKIEELMQNAGIIRNRAKLKASIGNSRIYKAIAAGFGGFDNYLMSFTGGKVSREPDITITTSPLSDALSSDLKKRGMAFVGSTTIYAFLQAAGIINAHQEDCFCCEERMICFS